MTWNTFHLGGSLRTFPHDFIVEEVWDHALYQVGYSPLERLRDRLRIALQRQREYLHFTLVKEDWDTIRALRYIGKRVRVSLKRFGIAGMKDKRAITAQRVSLWRGTAVRLAALRLPDMVLKNFTYTDQRITLGNAVGNRFTITIREIPKTESEALKILTQFAEAVTTRGVPNFYGPQRLGGGNADVGRAIKEGDLQLGVETILKKVQPHLEMGGIESIPRVFWYEKKMLRHLKQHPNDYAGALRKIPKKIRRLYTHAYQSHLFNETLKHALLNHHVLEFITVPGFTIPKMPELSTTPIERRSLITPTHFQVIKVKDRIVTIRFTLRKGEYASTFLSYLLQ